MKKRFQKLVASALIFTALVYSLDIHGLTHIFEDSQSDDKQHCEICIINHPKNQTSFSLIPISETINFQNPVERTSSEVSTAYIQNSFQNLFLEGQLFNRPPPSHI